MVSNIFYFPFHIWECHHPNWRTNSFIFFRVAQPPTRWYSHWIGLRENLQETMVFTIKLIGLSCKFSHHPILWYSAKSQQNTHGLDIPKKYQHQLAFIFHNIWDNPSHWRSPSFFKMGKTTNQLISTWWYSAKCQQNTHWLDILQCEAPVR